MHNQVKKGLPYLVLLLIFVFFYRNLCPLERIFGIPCPCCNMTTALYYLVQGKLKLAWYFHPLAFLLPFYLVFEILFWFHFKNWNSILSRNLRIVVIFIFVSFYCYRMLFVFPHYPMAYQYDSLLRRLLSLLHH